MSDFKVTLDTTQYVAGVRELAQKQLPYIMAKTLTQTVKDAQGEVKQNVAKAFKLRNTWTERGIRIKPADKRGNNGRIEADVHTDTANRKTGAPDYLGRQEDGGEKVPYGGRQYIAVPSKYLRQMAPGIIPAELRPRNLLGAVGGRYIARGRKGQMALRNQTRVNGFVFFIQKIKDGHMAIMGRYFAEREAYPFYLLITHANVPKSGLDMVATVERVANEQFGKRWDENWRAAYANGIRI